MHTTRVSLGLEAIADFRCSRCIGAFVAGLDAGLLYNEFPLMGGRLSPPKDELFDPLYAKKEDKSDLWWRNILENPITVQFNHRCLVRSFRFATRSELMNISGYHDLCLHRPAFRFLFEPEGESGAHSNGQENGQVRLHYGKCPSLVGNVYPPLSRPRSIGGPAPSWKCCPAHHHDPPVDQSASTGGCRKTLASSQSRENSWERSYLIIYPIPPI